MGELELLVSDMMGSRYFLLGTIYHDEQAKAGVEIAVSAGYMIYILFNLLKKLAA